MSPHVVIVTSWTERILWLVFLVSVVLFGGLLGGVFLFLALVKFVVNVLTFQWL